MINKGLYTHSQTTPDRKCNVCVEVVNICGNVYYSHVDHDQSNNAFCNRESEYTFDWKAVRKPLASCRWLLINNNESLVLPHLLYILSIWWWVVHTLLKRCFEVCHNSSIIEQLWTDHYTNDDWNAHLR